MKKEESVTLEVRLIANLKRYTPEDGKVSISSDAVVDDLISHLGVAPELVQMVFIDGSFAERQHPLADVKKVLLLPTIGGG